MKVNPTWRTDFTEGVWVTDEALYGGTFTLTGEDGEDLDGNGTVDGDGDLADDDEDLVTLTVVANFGNVIHRVQAVVYPPKLLLMIVQDPGSLSTEDTARKSLISGWGWDVRLLKRNANDAEIDAALVEVNVIYFPAHTSLEGKVKDRLKKIDVPVVSEHKQLGKEMKIVNDDAQDYDGTAIDILQLTQTTTDDLGVETTEVITHYITSPSTWGASRYAAPPTSCSTTRRTTSWHRAATASRSR